MPSGSGPGGEDGDVEEFTPTAAAAGNPVGSIRSRLTRARADLADALAGRATDTASG